MTVKYYKSAKDLQEVDYVIELAEKAISTQEVYIKDPSSVPKVIAASMTAVAGSGAAIAGLASVGTIGAGAATGAMGIAGVAGGIALAPISVPLALLSGLGFLIFKSKKEKEFRRKLQFRLKKAVETQNKLIREYEILVKSLKVEVEKEVNRYKEQVEKQANKIEELLAINKGLTEIISKLSGQMAA